MSWGWRGQGFDRLNDRGQNCDDLTGFIENGLKLWPINITGRENEEQPVSGLAGLLAGDGHFRRKGRLALASLRFAPTEVPGRSNWLAKGRGTLQPDSSDRQIVTIETAKSNVRR